MSSWLSAARSAKEGGSSSSKKTVCGMPLLPSQETDSPTLIVTSSGTNTSWPPSEPSFTSTALATTGVDIRPTLIRPAKRVLRILSVSVASLPLTASMPTRSGSFVVYPSTAPTSAPATASMAMSDPSAVCASPRIDPDGYGCSIQSGCGGSVQPSNLGSVQPSNLGSVHGPAATAPTRPRSEPDQDEEGAPALARPAS